MNNNKRKEIDNNDNDNDKITYKKFKNENTYESSNYRELQLIAGSLGLAKNGKKEVLYKSIENHLKNKESNENNIVMASIPINTFNKEQPQILTTIDGIDIYTTELLFWKIFRNKVIFKKIFSNFTNSRLYGYHDLIDIKTLFKKDNALEIILDKIKSNNHDSIIKMDNNIKLVLQIFKKDKEKYRLFYNTLFKCYSTKSSSTTITLVQVDKEIEKWITAIIKCSNFIAFQEFTKLFNIGKDKIKEIIGTLIYKSNYFNLFSFEKMKIISFLKSNDYIPIQPPSNYDSSKNVVNFKSLVNSLSLSFNINLKLLIEMYKLINV